MINRISTLAIIGATLAVGAISGPGYAQLLKPVTVTGIVIKVLPQQIQVQGTKNISAVYIDTNTKFVPRKPNPKDTIVATGVPEGEGSILASTVKIVSH